MVEVKIPIIKRIKHSNPLNETKIREDEIKKILMDVWDDKHADPYLHGTNQYLSEIGLKSQEITDAVIQYNEKVVKQTARILYEYSKRNGLEINQKNTFFYLLEAVHLMGRDITHHFVITRNMDPESILENFKVARVSGFPVVGPKNLKTPLEELCKVPTLRPFNLTTIYSGKQGIIIGYPNGTI